MRLGGPQYLQLDFSKCRIWCLGNLLLPFEFNPGHAAAATYFAGRRQERGRHQFGHAILRDPGRQCAQARFLRALDRDTGGARGSGQCDGEDSECDQDFDQSEAFAEVRSSGDSQRGACLSQREAGEGFSVSTQTMTTEKSPPVSLFQSGKRHSGGRRSDLHRVRLSSAANCRSHRPKSCGTRPARARQIQMALPRRLAGT